MSAEGHKYFFDVNNFDNPTVSEPEEDLPPPPPVYNEDELAQEKKTSFEEGRIVGHQEEQQSREQYIATQISELNTQILSLILSEQMREKRFEQEVIHLCRALIGKMFPALTLRGGYHEIEDIISRVVSKQPTSHITIEVPVSDVDDITEHVFSLKDIDPDRLTITGSEDLTKGNCRMKWKDGGAIRDHEALSAAIFAELDEVLAPPPQKGHNNESDSLDTRQEDIGGEQNG